MKKVVYRITEQDLHNIIMEGVKQALNEIGDTERGQYALGKLSRKYKDNGDMKKSKDFMDYAHEKQGDAFKKHPHYDPNKGHRLSKSMMDGFNDK